MSSATGTVRVVLESSDDDAWELRTSEFADFRSAVGEELLLHFCCCFIHADRLTSLVYMLARSSEEFASDSVPGKRNFVAFFSFAAGTLKEYGLALERLRARLVQDGLWDPEYWAVRMSRWEDWARDPENSGVRNRMAFHIDPPLVADGLASLAAAGGQRALFRGRSPKARDSWCEMAQDSVFEGLRLTLTDLAATLQSPVGFLDAHSDLQRLFEKILARKGLAPLISRTSGRRYVLDDGLA